MKAKFLSGLAAAGAAVLFGCATVTVDLPAITDAPTGQRTPGKVVWHDLLTHTPEASQRFYEELFGWSFENLPVGFGSGGGYKLIRHEGRLIGGMVDTVKLNGRTDISQWVMVLSVADVEAATRYFSSNGGQVLTKPTDLSHRGRLAVVADPEGALLALLQTRDGDPPDRAASLGDFLWDELWSADVDRATEFYAGLAAYDAGPPALAPEGAGAYRVLRDGETPRAGVMANPIEGLRPVWVNYLRVADPAAIAARAEELGGRVLVAARARDVGGQAAMVADPSGAGIALQTWPLDGNSGE
ncbi:MAG: VOC family protein [Gammaproteobacteria bacterium]|nr:VOC family protein [Gammaproteobacteria bacterium]MDH4253480.1 VOC family protein [Gammaproteobacteria bacterium]MDH5309713.1 VOC family protein [Gammaproteobacteria bacterium]